VGSKFDGDNGFAMVVNGVTMNFPQELVGSKRICVRTGEQGEMELNIEGRRPKKYLMSRSDFTSSSGRNDLRRTLDDRRSDRASRHSSRSTYSGGFYEWEWCTLLDSTSPQTTDFSFFFILWCLLLYCQQVYVSQEHQKEKANTQQLKRERRVRWRKMDGSKVVPFWSGFLKKAEKRKKKWQGILESSGTNLLGRGRRKILEKKKGREASREKRNMIYWWSPFIVWW